MKLKKIIIFYPSFERGGVEIILMNLINFFLKKKVKIVLISNIPKKNYQKILIFYKLILIIRRIVFFQIEYIKLFVHLRCFQIF